jgi:hypothetical protein
LYSTFQHTSVNQSDPEKAVKMIKPNSDYVYITHQHDSAQMLLQNEGICCKLQSSVKQGFAQMCDMPQQTTYQKKGYIN